MEFLSFSETWIDLLIIIILFIYIFERARKGFIYESIDLVGFVLSLISALRFYSYASNILTQYLSVSRGFSNVLGFLMIAFLSEFILYIGANYIDKFIPRKFIESSWNKAFGFLPALLSGFVLISFLLTTLLSLPIRPDVKQDIVESKIGGVITHQTLGLERYLSDIFGGAVQETLNFLTVKPQGDELVDLRFKTNDFAIDAASEKKMITLINKERVKNGLGILTEDREQREVARNHCKDMFINGYFSHYTPDGLSPFDRMESSGVKYKSAGENLAYAPTVEIAHTGLMESPGHKANILSKDFGRVGVGVISAGIYGKMFCQEFRD